MLRSVDEALIAAIREEHPFLRTVPPEEVRPRGAALVELRAAASKIAIARRPCP